MEVTTMEATVSTRWSDDRLDDLKQSVDVGFGEVKGRISRLDDRVDRLQHSMVLGFLAMGTMMFAGFGAMITLFATHF
jgi:hypothetical protein